MFTHYNHCHRATAHLQLNVLFITIIIKWLKMITKLGVFKHILTAAGEALK
jgi:hypothetical protein